MTKYKERMKINEVFDKFMKGKKFTFQNEIGLLREVVEHIEITLGTTISPDEVGRLYHRHADKQKEEGN